MTIKQIKIDRQRCIGCVSCTVVAPDAFVVDTAEGKAHLREGWEKVPLKDLQRACDSCPVQAIIFEGRVGGKRKKRL